MFCRCPTYFIFPNDSPLKEDAIPVYCCHKGLYEAYGNDTNYKAWYDWLTKQ